MAAYLLGSAGSVCRACVVFQPAVKAVVALGERLCTPIRLKGAEPYYVYRFGDCAVRRLLKLARDTPLLGYLLSVLAYTPTKATRNRSPAQARPCIHTDGRCALGNERRITSQNVTAPKAGAATNERVVAMSMSAGRLPGKSTRRR